MGRVFMYDFNVLEQARQIHAVPKLPFLDKLLAREDKPYQGLKILHNTPLTLATVFKIEALAIGGAEIITTCISTLPPEKRAVDLLRQANFRVQIEHEFNNEEFDFHLDCCGELITLPPPKIGSVELTQTGSKIYQNAAINYPMLSVDDSKLKVLETFFGTGDGFSRALYELVGADIYDKPFVIFGHGKVGQGIIYALKQYTDDITVIDPDSKQIASRPGIRFIDPKDISQLKIAIANAFCTITATGIKNLISEYYVLNKLDFGSCLLTNMGADDEYGDNFEADDVAFDKKPFNFSIDEPTALRYLDPIFYSHNIGIDLILSSQISPGYNVFPDQIAHNILKEWQSIHNENIDIALTI